MSNKVNKQVVGFEAEFPKADSQKIFLRRGNLRKYLNDMMDKAMLCLSE